MIDETQYDVLHAILKEIIASNDAGDIKSVERLANAAIDVMTECSVSNKPFETKPADDDLPDVPQFDNSWTIQMESFLDAAVSAYGASYIDKKLVDICDSLGDKCKSDKIKSVLAQVQRMNHEDYLISFMAKHMKQVDQWAEN